MTFLAAVNRRHKAALFLTLLAAGTSLVLGAGTKQTAGIALLGVALAWAFGTNSRVVHWLFVVSGCVLLTASMGFYLDARRDAARHESDEAWAAALETLRDPSKRPSPSGFVLTREELVRVVHDIKQDSHTYQEMDDEKLADAVLAKYPAWKRVLVEKRKAPALAEVVRFLWLDTWRMEVPGALLLGVGLGLVIGVRPRGK